MGCRTTQTLFTGLTASLLASVFSPLANFSDCQVTVQSEIYHEKSCDRCITHLSVTDKSFVLFNISSKFLLFLECYLLLPKMHKKVSK